MNEPHFKMYHESGVEVVLSVGDTADYYKNAHESVGYAIAAGFLPHPPNLAEGEQKVQVGYVVRREFEDQRDGKITPILDLYSHIEGQNTWKFVKVYLNTDAEIEAFEKASGMILDRMEKYIGTGDIERGKSRQLDKIVYKVPHPFFAVIQKNPKYDEVAAKAAKPGEYMVPKRRFVRWEGGGAAPASGSALTPGQEAASAIDKEVWWWKKFIATDPSIDELNDHIRRLLVPMTNKEAKAMVYAQVIKPWQELTNAEWDAETKGYVMPKAPEDEYGQEGNDVPF